MQYYKVQFIPVMTPGNGYIDGYRTAKRAKAVVAAVNAQFDKDHKIRAVYLGTSTRRESHVSEIIVKE